MRISAELRDHEAAGSLAEELPYWGWLEDGRTCLTRTGELIAAGRLEPAVVDGRSPEQIDRVLGRWQRLLSGLDSDTRLYFYLLRRPASPEAADDEGSGIVAVSQRKRGAFLSRRVQRLEAYLVWSHDPRLRTVADGPASGSASRLMQWWKRRRASAPTYLGSEIEAAAARFRSTVDAGRALVGEHTPIEMLSPAEASRLLSELINRPGMVWDGATGSGMNWRLALSELEAERSHLRLDGEPVILYSLLSPPGQAYANLLRELYCLDAAMTVSLEWRPWAVEAARRRIRGAQRHYFARRYSMMAHVQETEGTAAAMVDSAAATESDRLGEALVELEADGVSYGEATLTVALHGELASIERVDGDLEDLYAFEPERRTLSVLAASLPSATWPAWSRWTQGGAWGGYFDNPAGGTPDLEFADWQVIDLAGAVEHPDLCDAALSYLLERMRLEVEDPSEATRLKLMVVDEAWRYLQDPAVLSYLAEAAKTWRKKKRRADHGHTVRRGRDLHAWCGGAPRVDPDQALPREPRAPRRGRGAVPAERVGAGAGPGPDPQTRALPPPPGRGGGATARGRSGELLALHLVRIGRRGEGPCRRASRTQPGPRGAREPRRSQPHPHPQRKELIRHATTNDTPRSNRPSLGCLPCRGYRPAGGRPSVPPSAGPGGGRGPDPPGADASPSHDGDRAPRR